MIISLIFSLFTKNEITVRGVNRSILPRLGSVTGDFYGRDGNSRLRNTDCQTRVTVVKRALCLPQNRPPKYCLRMQVEARGWARSTIEDEIACRNYSESRGLLFALNTPIQRFRQIDGNKFLGWQMIVANQCDGIIIRDNLFQKRLYISINYNKMFMNSWKIFINLSIVMILGIEIIFKR